MTRTRVGGIMASNPVRVGFIENRGPNTLLNLLNSELPRAIDVRIAVAFITFSGLEDLLPTLQGVASRGRVRILCGLYQGFTEPRALRTLLRLQQRSGGRFEVRLSKDVRFHQKIYIVGRKTTATIIVGSSNMTGEGLRSSGEFSIGGGAYIVLYVCARPPRPWTRGCKADCRGRRRKKQCRRHARTRPCCHP